jgi:large conductance mechanosensitive channel
VTINHSTVTYGNFLNALISFLLVAAALFFFVVKPMNALAARRAAAEPEPAEEPSTKTCPECASQIPFAARRCPMCTSDLAA